MHIQMMSLEYSGIEIRQFTHSAWNRDQTVYDSAEIKREIPFCSVRSETYIFKIIIKRLNILSELSFTFNFLPFPSVALQQAS